MFENKSKTSWYVGGLHFECGQCGNCCAGPDEGYIWITRAEVELLAKHLKTDIGRARREYLKRIGMRTTIVEKPSSKDCIFLTDADCAIHPARPNQCRTWPFWPNNLKSPDAWNGAAAICPGINRGQLYTYEEIERLKKQKKWWSDETRQ